MRIKAVRCAMNLSLLSKHGTFNRKRLIVENNVSGSKGLERLANIENLCQENEENMLIVE